MVNLEEYKLNPCRVSAIPYWKSKIYKIPDNILVVHEEEYNCTSHNFEVDTLYFRLKHNLKSLKLTKLEHTFEYRNVDLTSANDLKEVVYIINKSYIDIQVNLDQVIGWTKTKVFDSNLWIFIVDTKTNRPVALGIADVDKEVNEGMLEWIQVLPEYRGLNLGQAVVNRLLVILSDSVKFVTVSGKVSNKTKPESLYRKCGFEGNDIWHIIKKNNVH
ncbi:MAG: GNAT family N-acetyltransferase [Clostridium sp.]|nr:GNAT family N-acetyltransferase [Clostridium sp.]